MNNEVLENLDVIDRNVRAFLEIQEWMILAKKENAAETYDQMNTRLQSIKAVLSVAGINVAELEKIQ